jgi:hypothetical protein
VSAAEIAMALGRGAVTVGWRDVLPIHRTAQRHRILPEDELRALDGSTAGFEQLWHAAPPEAQNQFRSDLIDVPPRSAFTAPSR